MEAYPSEPAAEARRLAREGRGTEAAAIVRDLLHDAFGLEAEDVRIGVDAYSLNSLNGTFVAGGEALFFKFHQEENEAAMVGEYYRARLLADAGFPVDPPLHVSNAPGRQILVYRRRDDPRFADVLRALDDDPDPERAAAALSAEDDLNRALLDIYTRTLHPITTEQSAAEPIHRLFHGRLVDTARPGRLAGRFASFYEDLPFDLPGLTLPWSELSRLRFTINGVPYGDTFGELFSEAFARLDPRRLAGGGVTAHGDAHNANVWFERPGAAAPRLVLFDPAFAGEHVPALLADVKTTFHNVFAHPLWLYEPAEAERRYSATADVSDGGLVIKTDWKPSEIRLKLLRSKQELVWKPLLRLLAERSLLPADWRRVVRMALFLCPTLVMNLRASAGPHNRVTSAIGLAAAVMVGSEPLRGSDPASDLLDAIAPGGPSGR